MGGARREKGLFRWTALRMRAAVMLGDGETAVDVARALGVHRHTVNRLEAVPEFKAEVERQALYLDLARRAARVRLAKRIVSTLGDTTDRDLLDWLRYIASETDGER